ncbi:MAG: exosortase [Phycisphaerae bacterium]|nr:exosortase [Phycisphaerae bacterium]
MNQEQIHVVVLCGCVNDGRAPLISQNPMAGWPVWGSSSFSDFLQQISKCDVADVSVCYSGHESFWSHIKVTDLPAKVRFIQEEWPAGSAGAVRQALSDFASGLAVVYTGNRLHSPSVDYLVAEHRTLGADFSVVVNPDGRSAGIYVCDVAVKEMIPEEGYSDIKEFLIPAMIRRGQVVKALTLSENVGAFSDSKTYLHAVLSNIESLASQTSGLVHQIHSEGLSVWASGDLDLAESCLASGTVVIMPGAEIGECCTIQGPVIIGANASIQDNTVVSRSVLWDGAFVGHDCLVRDSVIGSDAKVCPGEVLSNTTWAEQATAAGFKLLTQKTYNMVFQIRRYLQHMQKEVSLGLIVSSVAFAICFIWSYWTNLLNLWHVWLRSDEYSAGMLVPVLAGYVLWLRRDSLRRVRLEWSLWGLVGLIGAQAFRLFGLIYMYQAAENLSIVMTIGSCVLLLGGKALFKKSLTVLMFLLLMLPWPGRVQNQIALPLQDYATRSAVFSLETLGYDVIREGTVIHIGDTSVAVAEACNGLRMITAFFVIAGLVALIAGRSFWEKAMIFMSSLPIALICNTIRLAVTAIAFTMIKGEVWEQIFHDFGGYAMMPLALGIIVLELGIFSLLTMEPAEEAQLVIRREPHLDQETIR